MIDLYETSDLQYWGNSELIEHIIYLQDIIAQDMPKESEL